MDEIINSLIELQDTIKIIFPIHPRTKKKIDQFGFQSKVNKLINLHIIPPLGYLEFLWMQANARLVMTDSGGIQEETTVLGVPCLTLRQNTERPITVTQGTNQIVGYSKR